MSNTISNAPTAGNTNADASKPSLSDILKDVMRGGAVQRLTKEEYDAIKAEQLSQSSKNR